MPDFSNHLINKIIVLVLIASIFSSTISPAFAREKLWSKKFPSNVDWEVLTSLGVIIASTDKHLIAIDGKTGNILWSKKGIDLKREFVWPLEGTDIVLISDPDKKLGGIVKDANLYALEVMTGNVIWSTSEITGRPLEVIPLLDQLSFLYITDQKYIEEETLSKSPMIIPHMYNIDVNTGEIQWHRDFDRDVLGTKVEDTWLGYKIYNLSGYHRPVLLGDELYFFYGGITRWDYITGNTIWKTTYPAGDPELIRTDADPVFTDNVIYTSGQGQVKAIDRLTGEMMWDSDNLGLVPLLLMENGIIWAQRGGFFFNPNKNEWVSRGPFGVSAIDAANGKLIWDYRLGKDSLANMVLFEDRVIIADSKNIIALDKFNGTLLYSKELGIEGPMFGSKNSEGNAVFWSTKRVVAFTPDKGIKLWESGVKEPTESIANMGFRLSSGVFLVVLTGGTGLLLFSGYLVIHDIIPGQSAADARVKSQIKAEQYYWQNVKDYRNSQGLREAETIREYRLTLTESRKKLDPHIYLEGQIEDRKDFTGLAGINTRNGNIDKGVYLGDVGERYIIDYVEEVLYHFDGDVVGAFSLIPE